MAMFAMLLVISGCATGESDCAKDYLRASGAQRSLLHAGEAEVHWTLIRPGKPELSKVKTRATWSGDKYRVDVVDHPFKVMMYGPDSRLSGEPLEVSIWNESGAVLNKIRNSSRYLFRQSEHPAPADVRLFNVKTLGLPKYGGPQTNPEDGFFLDYDVQRFEVLESGLIRIDLARNSSDTLSFKVWFIIDPSRDHAVVEYGYETRHRSEEAEKPDLVFTVKGVNVLELFDTVWFPRKGRHEQFRNGKLDWADEFEVVNLRLNASVPDYVFKWDSLGVPTGERVLSSAPGFPSFTWNSAATTSGLPSK
ncbi:MAG: hypothetical protein KJ057_05675 [Phycisphaerae bacterium]|nr:MAG: hypothetical protein F9K17_12540 [Phycisphaerae bacterium]MBE7458035.1 hypothetical protein [Planctomycetia bacterium]MCK6464501.1 hypothetical protein [Phycisphaerae bacterium]MCL4717949.1 hypothetical protein [Phycisphaerae bacterium]NUQ10175.1 hypothetical protein [Phycisphaerae bacterium]